MKNFLQFAKFKYFGNKIRPKISKFYSNFKYSFKNKHRKHGSITKNLKSLFLFPFIFFPQIAYLDQDKQLLENKDIVKGEYENRIRTFASIEKRFLVFSKSTNSQNPKMTYYQFLDSLVPFQYIKTKSPEEVSKLLENNPDFSKIMKKIDVNGDGFINFEEFIIFSVFMTLPSKIYSTKFTNKKITKESLCEFLMNEIYCEESLVKITHKSFLDGRIIKTDYNNLYRYMIEFLTKVFKDKDIHMNEIHKLKTEIYLLISFYEFYRLPNSETNQISMENFAKILMSYVNIYKNKHIKKKIEKKLINLEGSVSFDEYVCFFWFLAILYDEFGMKKYLKLSYEDIKRIADEKIKKIPDTDIKLVKKISDKQIQLFISMFDENKDGMLDYKEIDDILKRRIFYSSSINDVKTGTSIIRKYFNHSVDFFKDNLWFFKLK